MSAINSSEGVAALNETRLFYEITGSGEPLVLIHGFAADRRIWDLQFETLAADYQVLRYDMRGFGRSDLPGGEPYTHHGDLGALLDHLGVARAHIIGHSMGGGIALDFALTCPERVRNLVLVESTVGGYQWSPEWSESWEPIFTTVAEQGMEGALPILLAHPLFMSALEQPFVTESLTRMFQDYSGWHASHADPEEPLEPRAMGRLHEISAPTLIVIGERGLPDFQALADILARDIPRAESIVLPGTGHVAPLEAGERLTRSLLRFLADK